MNRTRSVPGGPGRGSRGFTLIEVMVVVVIISLAAAIAVPIYGDAIERARTSAIAADTRKLYQALMAYNSDYGKFPAEADFDPETLAPLSSEGYFSVPESYTSKLMFDRVLVYLAPDVNGADTQVIAVARLAADTSIIVAVAYTDIIPDTDGWVDGVYIISDGDLQQANQVR